MAVFRTRFIYWLLKAYVKKWGKLFLIFFIFGLLFFILLIRFYPVILNNISFEKKKLIGISGVYTVNDFPDFISKKVASGLTKINSNGEITPDLSESWEILDNGKTYVFHLKKNIFYSDGTPFTSKNIQFSFKDVSISRPDDYTIIFKLKEQYAPFLATVSNPVLIKGYIGTSDLVISKVELNGDFINSIRLSSKENKLPSETYIFYPTSESLKTALVMGEVNEAYGITDTKIRNSDLKHFKNLKLERKPNYTKLITLFFNTEDPLLSDKKWRSGLTYALPDEFTDGLRSYNPYPPSLYYYNNTLNRRQDLEHAKLLINSAIESASSSAAPEIKLTAHRKYIKTANTIKNNFSKIGIKVKIEEVENVPATFQLYLGDFNMPKDPDQYTLWHSGQENNITRFKNLRIDKLLEDGRRSVDVDERIRIYFDFQKYIIDEAPAAFLYFPIEYNIRRI